MGEIADALKRAQGPLTPGRAAEPRARVPDDPQTDALALKPDDEDIHPILRTRTDRWTSRIVAVDPYSPVTEHYRHLALRVHRRMQSRNARTLLVTSSVRGEGKTTTACNLALALAGQQLDRRVALVDFDLRRPAVAASLGLQPTLGIEEVLMGAAEIGEIRISTDVFLDVYPVAKQSNRAPELLAGGCFPRILRALRERYDTVVIDSPPALGVADAATLMTQADVWIAVLRAGASRMRAIDDIFNEFPRDSLLGAVMNDTYMSRRRTAERYEPYMPDEGAR